LGQLIVIVAMFALLWLFLIAPQRRRAQAQRQLIASVEVGDEILTVGGLYGRVDAVSGDDELLVEIAPETQVRVARRAVAAVMPSEEEQPQLEAAVSEQSEQVRS
jgi:preprotein translocase subunit YajC